MPIIKTFKYSASYTTNIGETIEDGWVSYDFEEKAWRGSVGNGADSLFAIFEEAEAAVEKELQEYINQDNHNSVRYDYAPEVRFAFWKCQYCKCINHLGACRDDFAVDPPVEVRCKRCCTKSTLGKKKK